MLRRICFHWQLFQLQKQRDKWRRFHSIKFRQIQDRKQSREEIASLNADADHSDDMVNDEISELASRLLMAEAERYIFLPIPAF
jgi:hypothetical protein